MSKKLTIYFICIAGLPNDGGGCFKPPGIRGEP